MKLATVPALGECLLALLIGLILISFPAAADAYPVSGVWTATDTDFPAAANETCIAIKTFGVEAVSKKSSSELISLRRISGTMRRAMSKLKQT
jgi:hypothetical protein